MKKQFWLTPDQTELVVECLKFSKQKLCAGAVLSDAHEMAGRFVYRRINEVLEIFESGSPHESEKESKGPSA